MQIQTQRKERKAIGPFFPRGTACTHGGARETASRAAPLAVSSGVLSPDTSKPSSSAVSCKNLVTGMVLQSPCPVSWQTGQAGLESVWGVRKEEMGKAEQGRRVEEEREGKGERRKGGEARRSFPPPLLPLCCLPWRQQDGTLPGEEGGRDVGEKSVCREGTAGSTDVAGREEHLTEGNGRRAREKHRRQKVFKKIKRERAIRKEKGRE